MTEGRDHRLHVLALACLAACGADARYRGPDGAVVGVPWRCKDGTYVGTWIDPHHHSHLTARPMITTDIRVAVSPDAP